MPASASSRNRMDTSSRRAIGFARAGLRFRKGFVDHLWALQVMGCELPPGCELPRLASGESVRLTPYTRRSGAPVRRISLLAAGAVQVV